MVKEYSLKKDGQKQVSTHFKVREFACKDGSDKILVDEELVKLLEQIRNYFNEPITITSGYRTKEYNEKCGGVNTSQHLYGKACDIRVGSISPVAVALFLEWVVADNDLGIGLYTGQGFVHVDIRSNKSRWIQKGNASTYKTVSAIYKNI